METGLVCFTQEGCWGGCGILVLTSTPSRSSPPSSVFGLFLRQIFQVTCKSFFCLWDYMVLVVPSGPQSCGGWAVSFFLLSPLSRTFQIPLLGSWGHSSLARPFYQQALLSYLAACHFPRQQLPTWGRELGVREELLSLGQGPLGLCWHRLACESAHFLPACPAVFACTQSALPDGPARSPWGE